MEMQQVRYFLALARTLNFTRAAEECNVSQPSLTRAIRLLEAELGGDLLRRERRQSHLTELGQRMLPFLQQCYESALSAKNLAKAIKKNEIAPLSIVLSRSIDIDRFMPQLIELQRAYPGMQMKVRRAATGEIGDVLKEGEADLAIAGSLGETWERLDAWPLHRERFDLVLSEEHKFARSASVSRDAIASERFLRCTACEATDDFVEALGGHGVTPQEGHEVDSNDDLLALLKAGFGISIGPVSWPDEDGIVHRPLEGVDVSRTVTLYGIAGRRRSAAASTLLNLLRAADWSRFEG